MQVGHEGVESSPATSAVQSTDEHCAARVIYVLVRFDAQAFGVYCSARAVCWAHPSGVPSGGPRGCSGAEAKGLQFILVTDGAHE